MITTTLSPTVNGTTATGLDLLVEQISSDPGLTYKIARSEIIAGATAADSMNHLIVDAIKATGVANDGTLTTSDVYDLNAYLRATGPRMAQWSALHGDDEDGYETGYHLVQNDGAQTRMFGLNLADTVADGIYHMGFQIEWGRFLNEDGNANVSVETVAYWLSDLLSEDLASGTLANPDVNPYVTGTTGTGLDVLITVMGADAGLNNRVPTSDISEALRAADGMNTMIIDAIKSTGVGNDGTLTTSDMYDLNAYLRSRGAWMAQWTAYHGDDEDGIETGFHLIQNDGSFTRAFGENLVDTVADGIYHMGFMIEWGRFLNEDGNANASLDTVAYWLSDLLADDLASGALANASVDPYAKGTTGTGLDALISLIGEDPGLNNRIATSQITSGLRAADGMNKIIVEAIRATGVADDGSFSNVDVEDLNAYIRANHLAEWTELHGDDENGLETGFHLVQNDGGVTPFYGQNATNTVADGIYHMGFQIKWDRFLNEDGNGNATVGQVSEWLNLLLKDELEAGTLTSVGSAVDPATLIDDVAFSLSETLTVEDRAGYRELGKVAALALANGTFAVTFTADTPDDGDYNVLFSKDASGYGNGGHITAWISDGHLHVKFQSATDEVKLSSGEIRIEAGRAYDMAFTFGSDGAHLYLDGVKVDTAPEFTANLLNNNESLVIGAGTWGRTASNPSWMWDHFDGTISGFTVYDRALDRHEVASIGSSGPLPDLTPGAASATGALPAIYAGTGLAGEAYNRTDNFSNIDDLIAYIKSLSPTHKFDASAVNFGEMDWKSGTVAEFLGTSGQLTSGSGGAAMESIGIKLSGYVWIPEGNHLLTVRSDDGYLLKIGGEIYSSQTWGRGFEPTAKMANFEAGLYKIDLFYFENSGEEGLRLELDGEVLGAEHFFGSKADYLQALQNHGAMPDGGLPPIDDLPQGTTGTGLDAIVDIITSDYGLAHRVGEDGLAEAARSADIMANLLVEAIRQTGVANDGNLTASDMYDVTDYIRLKHQEAWMLAHGDDEGDEETGFHLVQNDGNITRLFGSNAIDTVADGLFHAGFAIKMGRYLNEDGNSNASVEKVAFWLSDLLKDDLQAGSLSSNSANPGPSEIVESEASHIMLGNGTISATLRGRAYDVTGNDRNNIITGSGRDNVIDGAGGNDTIDAGAGDDTIVGGRGRDHMIGGSGNDVYVVDNRYDTIEESTAGTGGRDTVFVVTEFDTYRLQDGVENLSYGAMNNATLLGNDASNQITSSNGDDTINGKEGNDRIESGGGRDLLIGGNGRDVLDGGAGGDTMDGGAGGDTFFVDSVNDKVIERAGNGADTVQSSVDYKLGANVEKLKLLGNDDLRGTGNSLNNTIVGNDGDNVLNGQGGRDKLAGGNGDDTYITDGGDRIIEGADAGTDSVVSSVSLALGRNIERLVLTGNGAIDGTGNQLDNVLIGNAGRNTLTGGLGSDRLTGDDGGDTFIFTSTADSRRTSYDTITDFSRAEGDRIDVSLIDADTTRAGNQAFDTKIGAAADFTEAGQYRFVQSGNGYMVEFNTDNDAAADMVIRILTTETAATNWFIL